MSKSFVAAFFLASLWLAHAPVAFCSDVTGEVVGPKGPVAGAQVTLTDAGGAVVGQGTTNDAGRYCITGVAPGDYKTALNPPAGYQPGATSSAVPAQGLTEDWSLSSATVASSSSNSPGACAAWYLGGGTPRSSRSARSYGCRIGCVCWRWLLQRSLARGYSVQIDRDWFRFPFGSPNRLNAKDGDGRLSGLASAPPSPFTPRIPGRMRTERGQQTESASAGRI